MTGLMKQQLSHEMNISFIMVLEYSLNSNLVWVIAVLIIARQSNILLDHDGLTPVIVAQRV